MAMNLKTSLWVSTVCDSIARLEGAVCTWVSQALPEQGLWKMASDTGPLGVWCSGKCNSRRFGFFAYVALGYLKGRIKDCQPLELWLTQNPISITAAVS